VAELPRGYRLYVFDADDTLRRTTVPGRPCPSTADEWELLPGVAEVLGSIPWSDEGGPYFGLASNQDQVAYGLFSEATARSLLRDLAHAATGLLPPDEALQLCPHRHDEECTCRKPKPGMLLRIMRHYGVAPSSTLFVGNAEVDRLAARAAGTAFRWAADAFSSSDGPSDRRIPRTARPHAGGWYDGA
jgi:histidinol-phosphate phosphatase family protein